MQALGWIGGAFHGLSPRFPFFRHCVILFGSSILEGRIQWAFVGKKWHLCAMNRGRKAS